jgi:hypothetical protein
MKVFNPSKNPLIYGDSKTIDGFGFASGTKEDFQELIDNNLLIIKEESSSKSTVKKENLVEEKISEMEETLVVSEPFNEEKQDTINNISKRSVTKKE